MQTSNTSKSTSAQTPCLRRAHSLPNELDCAVVGRPLFWFKAPTGKIGKLEKETSRKPPRRQLPQFPHLVRFCSNKRSPSPDLQMPVLLSYKPSSSDLDETHQIIETVGTTDTAEDDTLSIRSTDDEDSEDGLHGLSFLDESD
jgi:hypothetical protein